MERAALCANHAMKEVTWLEGVVVKTKYTQKKTLLPKAVLGIILSLDVCPVK